MDLESIVHRVLSKIILNKYSEIGDIQVIKFNDTHYRIAYHMNDEVSKMLRDSIWEETMKLLTMMSIDVNDFGIEFY